MIPANRQAVHPFDAAYALAFFLLLLYFVSGVVSVAIYSPIDFGDRIFLLMVAFGISGQLLRMYYHLKDFEVHIAAPGQSHFLELLPRGHSKFERAIRLFIAFVLVAFSKATYELHMKSNVGDLSIDQTPAVIVTFCFAFLIVWDVAVWHGLRQTSDTPSGEAWNTARRFYYLSEQTQEPRLVSYFKGFKFWERFFGLLASVLAIVYVGTRNNPFEITTALTGFMAIFALMVPVLTLLGHQNSNLRFPDEGVFLGRIKRILKITFLPIFSIIDYYYGESTMELNKLNVPRRRWALVAIGVSAVIIILVISQHPTSQPTDITSIAQDSTAQVNGLATLTPIRIATSKNLWCALTLIAHERGFFISESLSAQLNYQAAGRLNMDALLGGAVDFANVVETNIAYQSLNNTRNLAVHGRIVSATDYAILTKASARIRIPQDIKGKGLAYAQATGAESFVFWFLEEESISPSQITLIPLQPAGLVDHFLGGKTEAVATWEPFVSTIQKRSADLGKVFYARSDGFAGIMLIATRRDWATANPLILKAYERVMARAASFAKDSVSLSQEIISEQTGLPLETVISAWKRFDLSYVRTSEREAQLVEDVVRRIQIMLPEMRDRKPEDVHRYFGMTQ